MNAQPAAALRAVAGAPPSKCAAATCNCVVSRRGAWSVEVLAVMMAWKVALPHCVVALRGNHESEFATMN